MSGENVTSFYFQYYLQMFTKKFNFVNTYKPCLKKAEASEKTFPNYVAWSKIFVDYETTNNCQLCHFSEESVVGKTFHFIT